VRGRPDDTWPNRPRVPGHADIAGRVAGGEQAGEPLAAVAGEAFVGHLQHPPAAVERIIFAAAVAEGLVLHPTPALIQRRVGDAYDVEGVGDLHGGGEHRVEHGSIRVRQIQRGPPDPVPPRLGTGGEPGARASAVASRDDVEELSALHVDDLG